MGRLHKKKDPNKKKAQRTAKSPDGNGSSDASTGVGAAPRVVPMIKKAAPAPKAKVGSKAPNIFEKSAQFLREVKIELKKVTWPSRKQTMGSTVVVLVLWAIISVFLGLVDFSLSGLMRIVLP